MNTLVVYDSMFGNTAQLAHAIADALRDTSQVQMLSASESPPITFGAVELLVVGGPTQVHTQSAAIKTLLERLPPDALRGVAVAAFDTRMNLPKLISGAASSPIARRLRQLGGTLVVPPESFIVTGREGPLAEGELARAAAWARSIASQLAVIPT